MDISYYLLRVETLSGDILFSVRYFSLEEVFEKLVYVVSETSDFCAEPSARIVIIGRNDQHRDVYKHSFLADLCP